MIESKPERRPHLSPWTRDGSVLPNCSIINNPGNCDNLWAPDINILYNAYVLYYSVSQLGSQNSAIGLATSWTMEPGTWTDWGAVITSTPGAAYNASASSSPILEHIRAAY